MRRQKLALRNAMILLLLCFLSGFKSFADEQTSSVQVFNAIKWLEAQDRAMANPKIVILKKLIEIIYDPIIGRRWEERPYWEEVNNLWTEFRKNYCPSELELCAFPAKINDNSLLQKVAKKLTNVRERGLINSAIAYSELQLTPNLSFPGLTSGSDQENFSLRISETKPPAESKRLIIWNIPAARMTNQTHLENAVLYDVMSYGLGFSQKSVPSYFALDAQSNGFIQVEKVKMAAMDFAQNWKRTVRSEAVYSIINLEEMFLHKIFSAQKDSFEKYYVELRDRLNPENEQHKEDLARFDKERQSGFYPLEVFQAVAYRLLLNFTHQQAEFYQWAHTLSKPLNQSTVMLENLLYSQKSANPHLFLYLLHRIAVVGSGEILDQTVSQPNAQRYMLEILSVLLGEGKYKESNHFAELSVKIDYALILDKKYLIQQRPALYKFLEANQLLTPELLRAAPIMVQKKVLKDYLSNSIQTKSGEKYGNPILMSILRLTSAVFLGADPATLNRYSSLMYDGNYTKW